MTKKIDYTDDDQRKHRIQQKNQTKKAQINIKINNGVDTIDENVKNIWRNKKI